MDPINISNLGNIIYHLQLITDKDSSNTVGGVHFEVTSRISASHSINLDVGSTFDSNMKMFMVPKYGVYRFLFKCKILFPSADQNQTKLSA